jgi:outer membrane protein assembly factor BamB
MKHKKSRALMVLALATSVCAFGPLSKEAPSQSFKATKSQAASVAKNPAAIEAQKGDWSRWRGASGDGISLETGLLTEWPPEGPPLVWRVKGLGSGYATVAVAGGKIFTLGAGPRRAGGKNNMICLRVADGSIEWTMPIGGGGDPNSTPTVAGDLVFGVSLGGDLACCKVDDGTLVWSKNYERDFGGQMMSTWGYSESILVDGNKVVCTPGGDRALLAALDNKNGDPIWKTEVKQASLGRRGVDGAGYASIVASSAGGVRQYVTLVGRGVVGVDAATGKLLWSYNGVANGTANIPTPLVTGDYIFCSSGYDTGSALLKLNRSRQGFDVQQVYFLPANKMQNHHGGMIEKDGFVYCGTGHRNGFPLCINSRTGQDAWRPGRGAGSGSAAVTYADGHLYFRYEDSTMALIEATPQQYRLKGTFKIASHNGESWPHPVIAGGKLYLRDQDELLCYDVKKK